jgi:hypothetical protein
MSAHPPIFSPLKIAHLRAPGVSNFQDLFLLIASQLLQCHARGILRFELLSLRTIVEGGTV